MRVLDLFSGIGGFSLGLERAGMETVAFCEQDKFCQQVLQKHWPDVPIYDDIKELDGEQFKGAVDVVCGGFPCQPFSVAGQQRGDKDDRDLWPEMLRVIKGCQPRWVIGENVAGFVNMALDRTLSDLEGEGYTCETFIIPACAVNAPHRRDRVWIVAHSQSVDDRRMPGEVYSKDGRQKRELCPESCRSGEISAPMANAGRITERGEVVRVGGEPINSEATRKRSETRDGFADSGEAMADTASERVQGSGAAWEQEPCLPFEEGVLGGYGTGRRSSQWEFEPAVGRVADGIPNRVDRLKSLGNAVVPQIPEIIGNAIMEIMR